MRIPKIILLLTAALMATPGHSLDFTSFAAKAVTSYYINKAEKAFGTSYGHDAAPAEVNMPPATGNFSACKENFANGEAPIVPNAKLRKARAICFNGFAVLHSGTSKTPIYSAEVLNRESIRAAKGQPRTENFFADARLPSAERATLKDYYGSGLDRGHNRPAADAVGPESMAQSFSLANMIPQAPQMNRGAWSEVEQSTRNYVLRAKGNVYVVTGSVKLPNQCPLYGTQEFQKIKPDCTIGNGVIVPTHMFKLVYDATTQRAWSFWMENKNEARIMPPISYAELVRLTGIKFLPNAQIKS